MGSRSHDPLAARRPRGMTVARDPAVDHLEPDELARDPFRLLAGERFAPLEIALLHLHDPPEVGLPRRHRLVDVVAVECHPGFEPEGVAGAEPARRRPVAATFLEEAPKD